MLALIICMGAAAQTNFRHISYKEALAAAKAEGKNVFIDFMTSWCGPCKMMANNVFPQKNVGDFMNKNFVCIKIDAEKGEGPDLAKKYEVEAYPTMVMIDPNEKEIGRTVGGRQADAFIAEVERVTNPEKTPDKIKARYAAGERSAELVKDYAALLTDELTQSRLTQDEYKQKHTEIQKIVQDYYSGLNDADRLKDENMFVYRQYTSSTELPAAEFLKANHNRFKGDQKTEIDSIMRNLYEAQSYSFLAGDDKCTTEKVQKYKKELKQLGLDSKSNLAATDIMSVPTDNADKYFEACRKYAGNLTEMQRTGLVSGICKIYGEKDDATKQKASKFVRSMLPEMSLGEMYSAFMGLMNLEGNKH